MCVKTHIVSLLQNFGFSYDTAQSIYEQYKNENKLENLYDYAHTKLSLDSQKKLESIPLRDM